MVKKTGLILAAGGIGSRYGDSLPKQYHLIQGKPLFHYALESFIHFPEVAKAVIVMPESYIEQYGISKREPADIVTVSGGKERWESVKNGFRALCDDVDNIIVHDAARPFVPASVIRKCLSHVSMGKNVITGLPVTDTVKRVSDDKVNVTIDRNSLIAVQTPQVFTVRALTEMYAGLKGNVSENTELLTDEGGLAEMSGLDVHWIKGSTYTRKITDKDDFKWAVWMESQIRKGEVDLND